MWISASALKAIAKISAGLKSEKYRKWHGAEKWRKRKLSWRLVKSGVASAGEKRKSGVWRRSMKDIGRRKWRAAGSGALLQRLVAVGPWCA